MKFICLAILFHIHFLYVFSKKFLYSQKPELIEILEGLSSKCPEYIKIEFNNSTQESNSTNQEIIIYFTDFNTYTPNRPRVNITTTNTFTENIVKEFLEYYCLRLNTPNYTYVQDFNIIKNKLVLITIKGNNESALNSSSCACGEENKYTKASIVLSSGIIDNKIIIPANEANNEDELSTLINFTHSEVNNQKGISDYILEKDTNTNNSLTFIVHISRFELPTQISLGYEDDFDDTNKTLFSKNKTNFYGHIVKNVKLLYFLIDMIGGVQFDYVDSSVKISPNASDNTSYLISYKLMPYGCKQIKLLEHYTITFNDGNRLKKFLQNVTLNQPFIYDEIIKNSSLVEKIENVSCFWDTEEKGQEFNFTIDKNFSTSKNFYKTKYMLSFVVGEIKGKSNFKYYYSPFFLYSQKNETFFIDSIENFLINENDFSITDTLYYLKPEAVNNNLHIFPIPRINSIKNNTRLSKWNYNVSFAFYISTTDHGNTDAFFFMDAEEAFLSIFTYKEKNSLYLMDKNSNISTKECTLYTDDMSKRYYLLCDSLYQNISLSQIKNQIVGTHLKGEIIKLNITIYGVLGVSSPFVQMNYIPIKGTHYHCNKNYPLLIQKNETFYNSRYIQNMFSVNITKVHNKQYNLSFSLQQNTSNESTYVLSLPVNRSTYLIIDKNRNESYNQSIILNDENFNNELNGKIIKVLMVSLPTELNNSFISDAFARKTKIDYEIGQCSIMTDTFDKKMNKTTLSEFYNTHYIYHQTFFEKYFQKILIIGISSIVFIIVTTIIICKIIKKKCNSGYTAVKTNKPYEV